MSEGTKTLAAKTAGNTKRVYQASVAVGVDVKREIGQRVQSMDTETQYVLVVAGTASVIGIVGKEVWVCIWVGGLWVGVCACVYMDRVAYSCVGHELFIYMTRPILRDRLIHVRDTTHPS